MSTLQPLPQLQAFTSHPKCSSSTLAAPHFNQASKFSPSLRSFYPGISSLHVAATLETRLSKDAGHQFAENSIPSFPDNDVNSGCFSYTSVERRQGPKFLDNNFSAEAPNARRTAPKDGFSPKRKRVEDFSRPRGRKLGIMQEKAIKPKDVADGLDKRFLNHRLEMEDRDNRSKKSKVESPEASLRVGLELCSKRGDVMSAIRLYDVAKKEGIKMGQYHYAVLLYLCSSAATGMVLPGKSGSNSRSSNQVDPPKQSSLLQSKSPISFHELGKDKLGTTVFSDQYVIRGYPFTERSGRNNELDMNFPSSDVAISCSNTSFSEEHDSKSFVNGSLEMYQDTLDELVQTLKRDSDSLKIKDHRGEGFQVSEDVKKFALHKGFEVYDQMCMENVPMNEATFTSVARMALALGDGDMAFDMVKQMKGCGLTPRLRSYGPALAVFCNNGDVEKAFMVEEHMLEHNVYPEEPELEALLDVSIKSGKSSKVYYLLHKLRTSVRQVPPAIVNLIESWFHSKLAARVGKRKWDQRSIVKSIESVGGGWHGKGWLGIGKWTVCRSLVGPDGSCESCGEKLATIDLDPEETENFAKSVAAIATQREKNLSFEKFQKWLDYYGPFEAVVDGANVGLYSQKRFEPSKINAVVNGIRQLLPSRKWPLIVLHNRRISGEKMDESINRNFIEKWKNADALFSTPTGSNDDWYWLYAAIKCRCLIVTNDEMRDHLFQLLGNDFFPKWKERHQVHFSFDETGPIFRMPPPCSVVIQESEKGHWHIPIASEMEQDDQTLWLCCTRADSRSARPVSADIQEDSHISPNTEGKEKVGGRAKGRDGSGAGSREELEELCSNIKTIILSSPSSNHYSILPELEAAEKYGNCLIDFQI